MTIKGSLPALYAQDAQQQKLLDEITGAFSSLKGALDSRQQMFDPTLLAAAQGFLAPTKSGGFGESLGNVAAAVGPVQEQERRRGMEEAKMRLELAQSELGMRQAGTRLKSREDAIREYLGGKPMSAGAPGAAPAPGAPAPGAPAMQGAAPTGQPGAAGVQAPQGTRIAPPDQNRMTGRQYVGMTLRADPTVSITDLLKKAQDIDAKNVEVKESGVINHVTGMFYPFWKGEQVERQIYGKTYPVPNNVAMLLDDAQFSGDRQTYDKIAQRVLQGPPKSAQAAAPAAAVPGAAAPGAPGVIAPGVSPSRQTKSIEQRAEEKTRSEERGKRREQTFAEWAESLDSGLIGATQKLSDLNSLDSLVSDPEVGLSSFGVFEGKDIASAVLKYMTETGKPRDEAIRDVFINWKLPEKTKAKQILAYQLSAKINLSLRKQDRTPGEGAISDFEARAIAQSGFDRKDTPEGIKAKIAYMREKVRFDKEVGEAWSDAEDRGESVKQFLRSEQYKTLANNYANRVNEKLGLNIALPYESKAAYQTNNPAASSLLRQRLESMNR